MEKIRNNSFVKKVGLNRVILGGILVLMYLLFAILSPTFLSYSRILSALNYACFLGFLSLGIDFRTAFDKERMASGALYPG